MSDYEVTLVNDSMQEFYVKFYGPAESDLLSLPAPRISHYRFLSTLFWRRVADTRRAT